MTATVPMMMTVLFYAMQCTEQVDAKTKGSVRTECGQLVHCVEPIPDNDWQGGHFMDIFISLYQGTCTGTGDPAPKK